MADEGMGLNTMTRRHINDTAVHLAENGGHSQESSRTVWSVAHGQVQHAQAEDDVNGTFNPPFTGDERDARHADMERRAKAGDREAEAEAQRMVDEAAIQAGLPDEAWHATPESGTTSFLNTAKLGVHVGTHGAATERAENLRGEPGDCTPVHMMRLRVRFGRELRMFDTDHDVANTVIDAVDEALPENERERFRELFEAAFHQGLPWNTKAASVFQPITSALRALGYESIVYRNLYEDYGADSHIILDPCRIKSSAPFTYDDAGALIPLSARFTPETPDIRGGRGAMSRLLADAARHAPCPGDSSAAMGR